MFFRNRGNTFVPESDALASKCNELLSIYTLKGGILVSAILGT